jgi:hypothetical protein
VTHSLGVVERFCDEALWIDAGQGQAHGDPRRIVDAYLTAVERSEGELLATTTAKAVAAVSTVPERSGGAVVLEPSTRAETVPASGDPPDMFQATEGRWGSREVEIVDVTLLDRDGHPSFIFHAGDAMSIRLHVKAHAPTLDFVFGISLFNVDGVCCYGTNTDLEEMEPDELAGEAQVTFAIDSLELVEGTYKLDVAVHKRDGYPYDYHRLLYTFRTKSRVRDVGIYRPRHHWTFSSGVRFKKGPDGRE